VFLAFAPMNNPKISIVVFIENAGFGGTWAAPIAGLMIEKYLKGYITDTVKEKRMLDAVLY
jgi:penicillin-binding protein 2